MIRAKVFIFSDPQSRLHTIQDFLDFLSFFKFYAKSYFISIFIIIKCIIDNIIISINSKLLNTIFPIQISTASIIFNIYKYLVVNSLLKGLLAEPELYADFNYLAKWSKIFQNTAGIALFAAWIKVFKFISFNKTMAQLSGTITKV